jgi:dihydrofolate synthase / folylpolyglutamate synthase
MIEGARSDNAALDALLAQALELHPQRMDLSLGRIERLLARLGNPHERLPPVFHVAGTNGKGSTVAFIRACLEASGRRVHAYTSPHLVRFNERIRLAGQLIGDATLIALMRDVLSLNAGEPITFFELTTAVAFLAFEREPADAVVLEVGLGGRLDATNVVRRPAVTGIAQLGLDHQQWLGNTILEIAGEKAGIAKPGVPMVLSRYPKTVTARIGEVAGPAGAKLIVRGLDWDAAHYEGQLHYRDTSLKVALPMPRLPGSHQLDNAALAVAMLRHQNALPMPDSAFRAGMGWAEWPARLQRLERGPLTNRLPPGAEVWLDGGHNPAAGRVLADAFRAHNLAERPFYLVLGMLAAKDAAGFLKPFAGRATAVYAVPIADHAAYEPPALAGIAKDAGLPGLAAADVADALTQIARGADRARPPVVLIAGSLYLAGEVLAANGYVPG